MAAVDHIISEKHGGQTEADNLAYACAFCNRSKGSDVGSIVRRTGSALGIVVIVVPTAALMNSLGDWVHDFINDVQNNTLKVPPPRESVAEWPLVGEKVYAYWTKAYNDLPAVVKSMQPKIGDLAKGALGFVASIGSGLLQFLASLAVAGIMMAFGEAGARGIRSIFERVVEGSGGVEFLDLCTATIRAVAKGVLGVAFIQAIIVGLCLLIAGIPWAGVLAVIVLVLGIAQVPAVIVTLPAIGYLWSSGTYGTGAAVLYTVLFLVSGMADNVLKPLMLGRGVDAPMPVILLGALGGMAAGGILGMFVGATLLALGYQILMGWVGTSPAAPQAGQEAGPPSGAEAMPTVPPRRSPIWALVLLAPVFATSCMMVGPDFTPPSVPWLDGWSGDGMQGAQEKGQPPQRMKGDQWWQNFGDPVLEGLVEEAQRLNPSVRTAGMRILEARAQLGVAGSGLYPQLQQLNANGLRVGKERSAGRDTGFWTASIGLDIGWELDFWGKFRRGIESADAGYFASIAQYDDVQVLVAAQAASFYSAIRTIELRLRIAHENTELQKRSFEIAEHLFHSGNESELDVQQARTLYLSTLATIPELEASLRQTHNALGILLGRPPGPLPEMEAGREQIPDANLWILADVPADLLRRRPDVRAAELQLAAQSALIGVSKSELLPAIALTGSVVLSATSIRSSPTLDYGLGPVLVWNILDWGRLTNQVLVQDARFQQLFEQYQESVLRAARELEDAAIGFTQLRTQVAILEESVQAARRSLDIANVQYREGLVDFERVLDSQRALFSQQERLVVTRGGVAQNLIALYKAMGGGWQAGRERPIVDDATRDTMGERSNWKRLLDAPLPAASEDSP